MGIAKMTLVNIEGEQQYLDDALLRCTYTSVFHPEQAASQSAYSGGVTTIKQENQYTALLGRLEELAVSLGLTLGRASTAPPAISEKEMRAYLDELEGRVFKLVGRQKGYQHTLDTHNQTIRHLEHLSTLDVNFDDLFSCQYVQIRFGRLPVDSFDKLRFYDDKPFIFYAFDNDEGYYWCLYLTSERDKVEVDNLFSSLFFERLHIPNYAHGTPAKAIATIRQHMAATQQSLEEVEGELKVIADAEGERIISYHGDVRYLEHLVDMKITAGDMRHYATSHSGKFSILGFIPKEEEEEFESYFNDLDVQVTMKPVESDARLIPPVKLKNNRLIRPYEMFTEMYGLPSYGDIDPTPMVAITYTLLFGIMFGDLGQGLVISLVGFLMWRLKQMNLGKILIRIGFSSAFFGLIYGSVFGFEHLLDPMYHALGFAEKPVHVMAPSTTNLILITAVALGVLIIVLALGMNIALGVKRRDWGRAIFSQNGLAGMVFYLSAIWAAVSSLALGRNVMTLPYKIFLIGLPLALIFFKEPIHHLLARKKKLFEDGVGSFITESIFEMFEILLSFVTNTMSFLRVGGFILSHAGMMAVVFTLSGMVATAASPVVIIIGNVFVMCLEGLIVGIQVLRLEFYEIFSRFFEGDGKAYAPIDVSMPDEGS